MLINEELIQELYEGAGDTRYQKATQIQKEKRVTITKVIYENKNNVDLHGSVEEKQEDFETYFSMKNGEIEHLECSCLDNHQNYCTCKHILATVLEFVNNPAYAQLYQNNFSMPKSKVEGKTRQEYRNFKQMVNSFYQEKLDEYEIKKEEEQNYSIQIVPSILYNRYDKEMKLEFKIGDEKLYKIKNLSEFYERMLKGEKYKYGTKLEFIHDRRNFKEECRPLLEFVLKYAEIIKYVNSTGNAGYRYYGKVLSDNCVLLSNTGIDEFFEIMKGRTITIREDSDERNITFIPSSPNIEFYLEQINEEEFILVTNLDVYDYSLLEGKEYVYFYIGDYLYRCKKDYQDTVFKLLEIFRKNFIKEIRFSKKELPDFFSLVVPKLKETN